MEQTHLIDKVSMVIGIQHSNLAYDYQNQCSQLLQVEIMHIIQEVCDRYSNPDEHVIIEKLEIDLGRISAQEFKWNLLQKFKQEFSLASIDRSKSFRSDVPRSITKYSKSIFNSEENPQSEQHSNDYQWRIIKYYLVQGSLPWYVDLQHYRGIEKNLVELLQLDAAIDPEIRDILKNPVCLTRLLNQLGQTTISQLHQRIYEHKINWLDVFELIQNALSELKTKVHLLTATQLWEMIWQQPGHTVETVINSILHTVLVSNSAIAPLIISRLQRDSALFNRLFDTRRDIFDNSLELIKAHYQNLDPDNKSAVFHPAQIEADESLASINQTDNPVQAAESESDMPVTPQPASATTRPVLKTEQHKADPDRANALDEHAVTPSPAAMDETYKPDSIDIHRFQPAPETQPANTQAQDRTPAPTSIQDRAGSQVTEKESAQMPVAKRLGEFRKRFREQGSIESTSGDPSEIKGARIAESQDAAGLDRIALDNAGLIIFWPYLPTFFQQQGLLQDKRFKDLNTQQKAIHLLQYLASEEEQVEEYALVLNKILCNWPLQQPVDRFITLTDQDKEEAHHLIQAVIKNWSALGNTSAQNLRNSFILRKGLLKRAATSGWVLQVEKGPYDVLLDRIPWGLSMIKLPWMEQTLQVEW